MISLVVDKTLKFSRFPFREKINRIRIFDNYAAYYDNPHQRHSFAILKWYVIHK